MKHTLKNQPAIVMDDFDFAFFWVGETVETPRHLCESIRLSFGDSKNIYQLSDEKTPALPSVKVIRRPLSSDIMVARLQAYEAFENERPCIFLDADTIVLQPFQLPSFQDKDLLLVQRNNMEQIINHTWPETYPEFESKTFGEMMPYFFGFIAKKPGSQAFQWMLNEIKQLPERFHRWYGDQVTLKAYHQAHSEKVTTIDQSIYLGVVTEQINQNELARRIQYQQAILTFKGKHAKQYIQTCFKLLDTFKSSNVSNKTKQACYENLNQLCKDKQETRLQEQKPLGLQQIMQQPAHFGFVDCQANQKTFQMILIGQDDGVALRYLWNQQYEKSSMDLWGALASKSKSAIDIGAHSGAYTLAAYANNLDIHVFSFEPYALNYARLTQNVRLNGLSTKQCYMMAVSNSNGTSVFSVPFNPDYLNSNGSLEPNQQLSQFPVQSITLDSALSERLHHQIDLIKIDVEGHEAKALQGMQRVISHSSPVLLIEAIDQQAASEVSQIFEAYAYEFYLIHEQERSLCKMPTLKACFKDDGSPDENRRNYLVVPRSKEDFVLETCKSLSFKLLQV